MKKIIFWLCCTVLISGLCIAALAQSTSETNTPASQPVPVLDGAAGQCSVEFNVTTPDGKPAEAAKVKVHIAYRFGGFHKLDLEASTNSDGKVKFTGLPAKVRRSQLEFEATKGQLTGTTTVDPATECQAKRDIKLAEKTASGGLALLLVIE